jgi:hypothetical protein
VPGCGFLGKEAVEALHQTVARDGGVRMATVPGVVLQLEVATLTAYSTPFVGSGVAGAGVYIVSEEEAPFALTVLNV